MNRLFRRLTPVIGVLALWSGTAHAIISEVPAPSTSVDISNCIGNCLFFPFFPAMPPDLGDMLSVMGGSTAMGTRAADNATDGDSTTGIGESTYGGALGALANAMSSSPLTASTEIAATSTTAVWLAGR